jgi:hypothetical protein
MDSGRPAMSDATAEALDKLSEASNLYNEYLEIAAVASLASINVEVPYTPELPAPLTLTITA